MTCSRRASLVVLTERCCRCHSSGNAYFFKDDFYWVLKDGGINQEYVSPKATGMDWLRCPGPPPTAAPQNPRKDCSCAFNRSSLSLRNDCLLLVAVMLIINGLISVNN